MATIKHPSSQVGYQSSVPGGTPSVTTQATVVGPPVTGSSKPIPDGEGMAEKFMRGATRVWNSVRPRATRSK